MVQNFLFHQLRLVVYPIIFKVSYMPGPGSAGFLPQTVSPIIQWKITVAWKETNIGDIPFLLKHPAGLTTALVVIHFFQNRKILNHKNVVFTEAKWRFFTVSISGESKKQPEKASRILGPFSQNAARVAFFARPFFWSLSSCSRDGFAKLLSQILVSIAPAPLPLAQMAHQGRSVFWRERWRYTHLA